MQPLPLNLSTIMTLYTSINFTLVTSKTSSDNQKVGKEALITWMVTPQGFIHRFNSKGDK